MNKLKTINLLRLLVNCKKYLTYKQDPDTKEADDLLYEINNYIDGITNMQKTRDSNSALVHNAKTVIIDHNGNYHCYSVKLEAKDVKKFIFEIADNDYTIFSDLKIISNDIRNKFYQYEYID